MRRTLGRNHRTFCRNDRVDSWIWWRRTICTVGRAERIHVRTHGELALRWLERTSRINLRTERIFNWAPRGFLRANGQLLRACREHVRTNRILTNGRENRAICRFANRHFKGALCWGLREDGGVATSSRIARAKRRLCGAKRRLIGAECLRLRTDRKLTQSRCLRAVGHVLRTCRWLLWAECCFCRASRKLNRTLRHRCWEDRRIAARVRIACCSVTQINA